MQTAYIVAGYRSAVGKSKRGGFRFYRPEDLAVDVIKGLLASVPQPDRAAASRTESQIKRLSAAQKRLLCSHGSLAHQSEAALNISASITD